MKKIVMRMMALLLAAVLMLPGMMTYAATDAEKSEQNNKQIVSAGGKHSVYDDINSSSDSVEMSKTLTPTGIENYFDITLTVKTKENIKQLYDSVAVVLVLDASQTMNTGTRINNAQSAVANFITSYYSSGFNASSKELGIVAFNTDAKTCAELKDYSKNNEYNTKLLGDSGALQTLVNRIKQSDYAADHKRFTNIEAGLLLADNLLADSKAMHKFIIIATDGFPTTYSYRGSGHHHDGGNWSYSTSHITDIASNDTIRGYCPYMNPNRCVSECLHGGDEIGEPGYFYNALENMLCVDGTSYSDWAAWAAKEAATLIKNKGINIYSIGIDIGGQSIDDYAAGVLDFPNAGPTSSTPQIGKTEGQYENWLGTKIGGSNQLSGNNSYFLEYNSASTDVSAIFYVIKSFITNVKNATQAKWIISDPIPEPYEFESFIKQNGAVHNRTNGTITWDLRTINVNPSNGVYTYTMSYKIRIKNEKNNFDASQSYNTNGVTSFVWEEWNNTDGRWTEKTTEFPVPKAKAYLGSLEFKKVDGNGKGLAGAEFSLTHNADTCSVCKAAGNKVSITIPNAISDANGKVSFVYIPSGHDYILKEAKQPNGYKPYTKEHKVTVAYGSTTVTEAIPASGIVNTLVDPSPGDIFFSVTKTLDANAPVGKIFSFVLKEGNDVIERITMTSDEILANGGTLTKDFAAIIYDKYEDMGEHVYTVSEEVPAGTDHQYIYDEKVYTAKVTVGLNDPETQYIATLTEKIDGGTTASFHNEYLDPTEITLGISKSRDSAAPANDKFTFVINDSAGIVDIVEVTGNGSAVFETFKYAEPGTHVYTISEVPGNDNHRYVYDDTVYTATVEVKLDDAKTKYITELTVTDNKGGTSGENIVSFYNEYLDPTSEVLSGTKTFLGEAPEADAFTFALADENGNVIETVKNDAQGNFAFSELTFDKAGQYKYTVYEVRGDNLSILYDRSVYDVVIDVDYDYDAADNTKKIGYVSTVTITENGTPANGIAFENILRDPVDVILTAGKTIDNAAPGRSRFTFYLEDANGNIVSAVRNDNRGNIVFDKLTFDKAGTYHYTMREKIENDRWMFFDRSVYTVEIVVTADHANDDPFEATVTFYTKNDNVTDEVIFRNIRRYREEEEFSPNTGAKAAKFGLSLLVGIAGSLAIIAVSEKKLNKKED